MSGTKLVPQRRVQRVLRREFGGHNLFTVTTADVREALSSQRYIADVVVDREFPSTLQVTVREHDPVAYALAHGRWYVLAGDAYVICEVTASATDGDRSVDGAATDGVTDGTEAADESASPSSTPMATNTPTADASTAAASSTGDGTTATLTNLIDGPPIARFELPRLAIAGRVVVGKTLTRSEVTSALAVIDALPAASRQDLAVVQTGSDGIITLRFSGGPVATWGDTTRTAAKALALRLVLTRYEKAGRTCTFIDVSLPDRVLARPILK